MEFVYLTRHGRTYVNELWSLLSPNSRNLLRGNPHDGISKEQLMGLISDDDQTERFIARNGVKDSDFPIFPFSLSQYGSVQANVLGRYLASRTDITKGVVPTKASKRIFRNEQTAKLIQKGMGREFGFYGPDALTEKLGYDYANGSNGDSFDFIREMMLSLGGYIFVLNGGLLERLVGSCGEDLEFFDNCGLVVLNNNRRRLSIGQGYLSNEQLKERL
ncbi:hypothetical protein J4467_01785 [Candidatus Woesearchaeota archaeon]|nr:hypothetical protein [Candidatus Woesearchaeota archaeon]